MKNVMWGGFVIFTLMACNIEGVPWPITAFASVFLALAIWGEILQYGKED